VIRCADAHALEAIVRLAQAFAAAAPREQFFHRLSEVARDSLVCHLAGPAGDNSPEPASVAHAAPHQACRTRGQSALAAFATGVEPNYPRVEHMT
jgi:hypothetical protein